MKTTTKAKNIKMARKAFKEWEKAPYGYIPREGEYFVYMDFYGKSTRRSSNVGLGEKYISNKGTILYYNKNDDKIQLYDGLRKNSKGYLEAYGYRLHPIVFFSFYNAKRYSKRLNHEKAKKEVFHIFGLNEKSIYGEKVHIHHIDQDKTNCNLSNLQAIPERIHNFLTNAVQKSLPDDRIQVLFADEKYSEDINALFNSLV